MSGKSQTLLSHTADMGLSIRARSLRRLFMAAAEGLYGLMTDLENFRAQRPSGVIFRRVFSLEASGAGELLLAWLRELLYVFSAKRCIFLKYRIDRLDSKTLKIAAYGRRFDPRKHEQRYEVKAVTYHSFKLKKNRTGWLAKIIFDI